MRFVMCNMAGAGARATGGTTAAGHKFLYWRPECLYSFNELSRKSRAICGMGVRCWASGLASARRGLAGPGPRIITSLPAGTALALASASPAVGSGVGAAETAAGAARQAVQPAAAEVAAMLPALQECAWRPSEDCTALEAAAQASWARQPSACGSLHRPADS